MFYQKFICILLLISAVATADEGPLQSPYFIDGLHCSGLAQESSSTSPTSNTSPEDSDPSRRIESEEDCSDLLKTFGIEPYTWISPTELEKLSAQVRESPYFESAALSVKRSELKNHVHLFLKVQTKSRYVYSFGAKSKLYSPDNQLFFTRISGEIMDRSLQPNSKDTWAFHLDTGFAGLPLESKQQNITPDSSEWLYNRNFYFLDLSHLHQRRLHQNITWSFKSRLNTDNVDRWEGPLNVTVSFDSDLIYSRYFRFLHGSIFGGVSAIVSPNLRFLFSTYNRPPNDPHDVPLLLPGFKLGYLYGDMDETYLRTEFSMYRAFSGPQCVLELRSFLNLDLGKGFALNAALNLRDSRDIILPRDKAPSTDAMNNNFSFGTSKKLSKGAEYSEVSLSLGFEKVNYTKQPYSQGVTPFAQAGYRLKGDTLNLDLSFTYLGVRIF